MTLKYKKILALSSFIITSILFVVINRYVFMPNVSNIEKLILVLIMITQFISLFYMGAYFGDFTEDDSNMREREEKDV